MDELLDLTEIPKSDEMYMIAGWRQWADAGATSSALPRYLVKHTKARRIGRIKSDGFYLFQLPGTHHFLRPEVKFKDGHRREIRLNRNEFWYTGNEKKGLVIFSGDEPHLGAERYADVFFNAAAELRVKRVVALGGVYAVVPYDKDRNVSCSYSLLSMKDELDDYALRYSNYEGGVSIGSYMAHWAEVKGAEYVAMHAFVPMYDFSQLAPDLQGITVENDFKAWYDVMRRVNHMFGTHVDLGDLERQAEQLAESIGAQVDEMEERAPQAHVREYMAKLTEDFAEMSFMPLDDVWDRELGDIFKDME
ncbi:MAG: PAC2 family protein [Chloroflexi bacterium]|nr:PAC2 family protein [Chloroflexota bacterium]